MAENAIRLEGIPASTSGTLPINMVTIPTNVYSYGLFEAPGVVAANNFLSLFNPVGSGKTLIISRLSISPYATAAAAATNNMQSFRTSAASAGTLIAASTINKFNPSQTDSIAQVRIGNPTVTITGLAVTATAPAITSASVGATPVVTTPPEGSLFVVPPGTGVVSKTAAGLVSQLWNISLAWAEI